MSNDNADAPTPEQREEIAEIRERNSPGIEKAGAEAQRGKGTFTIHAYGLTSEPIPVDRTSDLMSLAQEVEDALDTLRKDARAGTGGDQIFLAEVRRALEWGYSQIYTIRHGSSPDAIATTAAHFMECDKWLGRTKNNLDLLDRLAVRESEIFRRILNRAIEVAQAFVDANAHWRDDATKGPNTPFPSEIAEAKMWEHKRDTAQQIVDQLMQLGGEISWALGEKAMPIPETELEAAVERLKRRIPLAFTDGVEYQKQVSIKTVRTMRDKWKHDFERELYT